MHAGVCGHVTCHQGLPPQTAVVLPSPQVQFVSSGIPAGCPWCRQRVVGVLKHALVLVRFRFWKPSESETRTSNGCEFLKNLSLPFREFKCKHCSCTNTVGYSVLRRITIRLPSRKMKFFFSLLPLLLNTEVTGARRLNALRSVFAEKIRNQKSGRPSIRTYCCPAHDYKTKKLHILKVLLPVSAYILRAQH